MNQGAMPAYPESESVLVSVFYLGAGDDPFIFHVNGKVTVKALTEIEEEIRSDERYMGEGAGDYVFSVSRFDGQYDEYGRCEFPPGWEINFESFAALSDQPTRQEGAQ